MNFISMESKNTQYGRLFVGDTFMYDGEVYMKVYDAEHQRCCAVNLTQDGVCGKIVSFEKTEEVLKVNCELQEVCQ